MKTPALGAAGVLGKHPAHGDFLALGNRSHEFTSFDAFLTRNIEWAEQEAGPRWEQAFPAGGVFAFAYRPTEGGRAALLAGALGPSNDRAGRRFPLSVAMPLLATPELLAAPEILPLVLEACWQLTSDFVLAVSADPTASLAAQLATLQPPELALDEALESYDTWTRTLPTDELWALIFGDDPRVDPAAILALVAEAVRACRGVEQPTTPLSLRLPLGAAGGAAVCFWLDWVRCIARWRRTLPTFFWSHDGQQGTLLLHLGVPPRCTLAELWSPTTSRDEICDVATAPWNIRPTQDTDPRLLALPREHGATIATLLHAAHALEL